MLKVWSRAFFSGCAPWLIDGLLPTPPPHLYIIFPNACVASSFLSQGHQSYRISTYLTTFCNLNHCFKTLAPSSPISRAEGWEFLHGGGEACLLQPQWPLGCGKGQRQAQERLLSFWKRVTSQGVLRFRETFHLWGRLHCFALPCS